MKWFSSWLVITLLLTLHVSYTVIMQEYAWWIYEIQIYNVASRQYTQLDRTIILCLENRNLFMHFALTLLLYNHKINSRSTQNISDENQSCLLQYLKKGYAEQVEQVRIKSNCHTAFCLTQCIEHSNMLDPLHFGYLSCFLISSVKYAFPNMQNFGVCVSFRLPFEII